MATLLNTLSVRNPRNGVVSCDTPSTAIDQLDAIVSRARAAQVNWQALGVEGRIAVLARWRDLLAGMQDQLIAAVTLDTGRIRESRREAANIGKWIDRWSVIAPVALASSDGPTSMPGFTYTSDHAPIPVLGVISPWNFPMSLSVMDAIPALLAGCAVIIKPSEVTPHFIGPIEDSIAQVPELAGVLTYIRGAGDLGAALIDRVDGICFTGSTATGRKVAARAGARLIPCFVELGGKDAAIVLEGADLERAARAIVTGATLGTGQQCYSVERIYVARAIHDQFLALLTDKARKLDLALPQPDDGPIGPLIFAPQAAIIEAHLADARAKGAIVHCGGEIERHGGGLWVRPTVLSNVTHDMAVMRDETFGPLLPVMAFDSVDEAVRLANDSNYGLTGAVFGPQDQAMAVARRMNAGGINVNDAGATPFFIGDALVCANDSFGDSGLGGSRTGPASILRFVRQKMIVTNVTNDPSAWWYDV
ncbi:MAG: aldehyde dehydrogenase family protein [Rhodobacter sp.]|nr:aldehyde dehydrogenase family protein [Rhodobacter sp.]